METQPIAQSDSTPPPFRPSGSDKIWVLLSHLSSLIGLSILLPLVVYLAMRHESEYVASNAREALNFHISVIIYIICCIPLVFLIIGIPIMGAIGIASLVFSIVAAVKSSEGRTYRYPVTLRLVK